jgi:beta-lactamase class A
MNRRAAILGATAFVTAPTLARAESFGNGITYRLQQIEWRVGGRLGVYALNTGTQDWVSYRERERFPMCSTFKVLAVGAVLRQVDGGRERLDRRIPYGPADLLPYAPVTRAHLAAGEMTLEALCAAAVELSDNTAANLLLRTLGGPPAVTRFARALGDPVTRPDRTEPALNTSIPGDPRDTTSPERMSDDLQAMLLGSALSAPSRRRLEGWMIGCKTGTTRLRAGLPADWIVGDKTGTGPNGGTNDIAIVRPPGRAPILIAAYLTDATRPAPYKTADDRDAALADVARVVAERFS